MFYNLGPDRHATCAKPDADISLERLIAPLRGSKCKGSFKDS